MSILSETVYTESDAEFEVALNASETVYRYLLNLGLYLCNLKVYIDSENVYIISEEMCI